MLRIHVGILALLVTAPTSPALALASVGGLFATPAVSPAIPEQQGSISAEVSDAATGQPIPDVAVSVQGTDISGLTGPEGRVLLVNVPVGTHTIVAERLGYAPVEQSTVTVAEGETAAVSLAMTASALALDAVVVIGYGTERRSRLTGSVGSVDSETIGRSAGPLTTERFIQGRVAGVNVTSTSGMPGQGLRVDVRGAASITSGNEPLYVVDGVPISGGTEENHDFGIERTSPIAHINPSDIESIDILKDAAATAIYGSRAMNGVVLITTKRGRSGPTQIEVSSSFGVEDVPKRVEIASSDEYFEVMNEARANFNRDNGIYAGEPGYQPPLEDLREPGHVDTDWFELVTRERALVSTNDLSVSGGDERTRFFLSLSHKRHEGIIKRNRFERLSGRANFDHRATDRLDLRASIGLSRTVNNRVQNEQSGRGLLVRSLEQRPFDKPFNEDGSYTIGGADILRHNGVQVLNEQENDLTNYGALVEAGATYAIARSLRYQGKLGGDFGLTHEYVYRNANHPRGGPDGTAFDWRTISRNLLIENTLTLDHAFSRDVRASGLLGHSFQTLEREPSMIQGQGFPSPGFGYITSAGSIPEASTSWTSYAIESIISRVNVDLKDRYTLAATLRRDGSSRFARGQRYGLFPSAAVVWHVDQEPFLRDSGLFSELRLRASYGLTGNQNGIANFAAAPTATGGHNYRNQTGIAITNAGNPDLTWETAKQFNMGVDFSLLNRRLAFTMEVFVQDTEDLLFARPLHGTTGFSSTVVNIGSMSNRGFEASASTLNLDGKLNWTSTLNISFTRNEITSLLGDEPIPFGGEHVLQVGEPLGTFYMLRQIGLYQSDDEVPQALYAAGVRAGDVKFEDVNGDGNITSADRQVVGSANPDLYGGFTNSLQYENFDLSAFVSFKYGNRVFNSWSQRLDSHGRFQYALRADNIHNRWTGPGTSNDVPRARLGDYNVQNSTRFLEDGSFARLQNLTLGYTLPGTVAQRLHLDQFRLYLSAKNLITLTGYSGMDPEVTVSLDPRNMGVDHFNVPQMRTITFGVNAGF